MDGGAVSLDLLKSMKKQLDGQRERLRKLDAYWCGDQPLNYIRPDVQSMLRGRLTPLVINWPRVIVSSIEERLDVEGFRSGGDADERLWSWWQANDLDEWSQLGHIDAMVESHAFASVWADPERPDRPRIAVESAHQVTARYVPGSTRELDVVLKAWREGDEQTGVDHAVLSDRSDVIERWERDSRVGEWRLVDTVDNPLTRPPYEPLVNRRGLLRPFGESELADVLPVADAVNKLATDMMVSSEFHAMQRRWATGIEVPREGGAQQRTADEMRAKLADAYPGNPWIGGKDVHFGQFAEASLDNFINGIKLLTSQIAAIAGLPPHYLGINADNPASAEAIRSAESSLVQRAKRKQRAFGGSWERVMRLAVDVVDGLGSSEKLDSLETIWRDPATPTPAEKADAAVKLTQGENPIVTVRQAQEDLGYTPQQIAQMADDREQAAATAATSDVRARVDMAQQLMDSQGLSQPAAYAAVGLLQAASQMGPAGGQTAGGAPAA
jgi:hypothetical protein